MRVWLKSVFGSVLLVGAAFSSQVGAHARGVQSTVSPSQLFAHGDPCGYRYAAWGYVQEVADYVDAAAAGNVDDYMVSVMDNYLIIKGSGIKVDYHTPNGSKAVGNHVAKALGDVDFAIQSSDQGDNGGFQSGIADAQRQISQTWPVLQRICSWKGKATTWTGWLNEYGYNIRWTPWFSPSGPWELDWEYGCPDDPSSNTQSTGNFIVSVYNGSGLVAIPVNKLGTGGYGFSRTFPRGSYRLQVNSECAWGVKAGPGS